MRRWSVASLSLTFVAACSPGDGGGNERPLTEGHLDEDPAWSPDGRWIMFVRGYSSKKGGIYKVRPDGPSSTRSSLDRSRCVRTHRSGRSTEKGSRGRSGTSRTRDPRRCGPRVPRARTGGWSRSSTRFTRSAGRRTARRSRPALVARGPST
ncbi:MAG: hypothetical protein GEU68_07325 [Actinobacteria bacterium]|nr:hypothetical protein [Actinomycetota bacterium]